MNSEDIIFEGQDLTKGDILKQLWSLAWPMMLSMFFHTLYNLVDAYWVSKLSAEAIAAVSISQITLFVMIALGFGVTAGSGVVMAMHIGAKNKKEAERVLGQSFALAIVLGIFFTFIALIFREQLLTFSGAGGEIFEPAMEYFTVTAYGAVLFFIMTSIMFAFNSQGDTFTITKFFAVSTFFNLILDPIFIFGWKSVPAMGVSGAAVATLVSQAVFIALALRHLCGESMRVRFYFSNLTMKWDSVKEVLRIGIPASLTQVIMPIGLSALTYITALSFFEPGAIAFSLGFRMEFFAFLPAAGFGFGAMAMIGQNLGAKKFDRAKEVFKKALKYGFLSAMGFGIFVAVFSSYIIGAFTSDPIVREYALYYMWTVSLSYGFLAAMMVEASSFQALGRSWPGFWIFFTRYAIISIPLGFVFTKVLGYPIIAMWISIIIGNIVCAIFGYFWIKKTLEKVEFTEEKTKKNKNREILFSTNKNS